MAMPDRFSSVVRNGSVQFVGPDTVADQFPHEAAQLAFAAIASFSKIELGQLRIFLPLLGGRDSVAAAIFAASQTQHAKKTAIRVAADTTLKAREEERRYLDAILALTETQEKARNKLAHWVWGRSPEVPDALLLADPSQNFGALSKDDVYVYRFNELRSIVAANERLYELCNWLSIAINIAESTPKKQKVLGWLAAAPEIIECVARLAAKRAKTVSHT